MTPQFPRETDRLYTVVELAKQSSSDKIDAACEPPASIQSPTTQLLQPFETPMSPSIYSRHTDGASIVPTDSVLSFPSPHQDQHAQHGGSAVILTSQSVRSYVIGTPSPKRASSTRSSRDWKAWLSNEVSAIETVSQEDLAIDEQYNTPSQRHKRDLIKTIRTSQTGSDDTTVIVRGSFDTSTPRAQSLASNARSEQQIHSVISLQERLDQPVAVASDPKVGSDSSRESVTSQTQIPDAEQSTSAASALSPSLRNDWSTASSTSSTAQPALGTPGSARMNDRFPFLDTGRRLSNNSRRSLQSKSPTSSEGSSLKAPKGTPRTQAVYSDLSAPAVGLTTTGVPDLAFSRAEFSEKSKENVTPPLMGGQRRSNVSPLELVSRPKSLQPFSPSALYRSSPHKADDAAKLADESQSKDTSVPVKTLVTRPSLRITIRPLSPEKVSRRPRSAVDMRDTPSPRPASEVLRPALQSKASSRLSTYDLDLKSDTQVPEHAGHDIHQRDGSVTPGQRMADRFLRERKSATVLERGVRKSSGKFVREDTPAFL